MYLSQHTDQMHRIRVNKATESERMSEQEMHTNNNNNNKNPTRKKGKKVPTRDAELTLSMIGEKESERKMRGKNL